MRWMKASDSPLTRRGSHWNLVSREDSWFLLAGLVLSDDLRRFEAVALECCRTTTLRTRPAEERWQATIQKKVPKYSGAAADSSRRLPCSGRGRVCPGLA